MQEVKVEERKTGNSDATIVIIRAECIEKWFNLLTKRPAYPTMSEYSNVQTPHRFLPPASSRACSSTAKSEAVARG
jgi:hypothetical protein